MATAYKNGYLTRRALASEIKIVVAKKHDLKPKNISIGWLVKWQVVKFPSGLVGKAGKISLCAPGYKPTIFSVYQEKNKKWYMR